MTFKVTLMFALVGLMLLAVAQTQDAHGGPGREGESDNGNGNVVFGYFGPGNSDKTPGNADNKDTGFWSPGRFGPGNSDKTPGRADNKVLDAHGGPGREGNSDNGNGNGVYGYFGPGNSDKTPGNADNKAYDRWGPGNWGPGHWGPGNHGPGNNGKWPGWHK